ncbi:MAG: hypothetical protein KC466_12765, partial [Myxococcales bacterium]|nr:hypothetical protein [Myxococcales bacterium]
LALSLHRRFPRNAVLHAELLEALLRLGRANEAVIETARIAERALRGDRNYGEDLAAIAAIGRARALLIQGEAGEADRLLDAFGDGEPLRPRWAYARVLLVRAQIRDFQGRRDEAVALYARVRDYEGPRRSEEAAEEAEIYLEKPFTPPRPS